MHLTAPRLGRRALLAAALPAAFAAAALPSAAQAASVGIDAGTLRYTDAGRNQSHEMSVFRDGGRVRIADSHALDTALVSGDDCFNVDARTVSCSLAGVSQVRLAFGSGNDLANPTVDLPVLVTGAGGNDTVLSGHGAGTSRVDVSGGAGHDVVSYAAASAGVVVTKDRAANDGRQNRDRDNVRDDVEAMIGSSHNDSLNGNDAEVTEVLVGGPGTDVLSGNGGRNHYGMGRTADGADTVRGGLGVDHADYSGRSAFITATLSLGDLNDGEAGERDSLRSVESIAAGQGGSDLKAPFGSRASYTLIGGAGIDRLEGAEGIDTIIPLGARDTVDARGGDDTIAAVDGLSDLVTCGTGTDTAQVDATDSLAGCEVRR